MNKRRIAMYIRLSDEDEDVGTGRKDESNSITNQRSYLYSYIREHEEFECFDVLEYFDDGFTGTEFDNRQEFQRMMKDAENGRFDTLLVKDFSRFGRDYLEVGNYLEFVFPVMGIRFISVNDGYDSDKNFGMTGGMDVAFKNLIYQLYSRDLSKKIKSARKNRNRNGEYTASFVCYVYRKDPADKHKLVIEEETAAIVREIFSLAIAGKNSSEIARMLNARKVPTRLQNQWKRGVAYVPVHNKEDYLWSGAAVRAVLTNEQYTGTLIQNRYESVGFGEYKKLIKHDREEWSVVPDAVPVIISRSEFEEANRIRRKIKNQERKKGCRNLFVCPYCERKLCKTGLVSPKYVCSKRNLVTESECERICMPVEYAEELVVVTLNQEVDFRVDRSRDMSASKVQNRNMRQEIEILSEEYERIEKGTISDYVRYRDGTYSREKFLKSRRENKKLMESIRRQIEELEVQEKDSAKEQKEEEQLVSFSDAFTSYDVEMIGKLVEKVYIYNDKDIEIVFK